MRTDTAHIAWNSRWSTEDGRADWLAAEPEVVALSETIRAGGEEVRALDLGCGVGRHALHFARVGFEAHAIDMAEAGVEQVRQSAAAMGVTVEASVAPMTQLPFPDGHFDYVLSFNVIYHGDGDIVRAAIAEIRRVLKPGGHFQGTMLSKRNVNYGVGEEVAPNTFVRENPPAEAGEEGVKSDKDHPHFYCNANELTELFEGFELYRLEDRQQKPGGWHWHFTAERLG